MNVGTKIKLKIKFEDRQIEGEAVVKNIREIGKNVCYGTEFSKLNNEDKNYLIKFVQNQQQKLLKEYKRLKLFE